MRHNILIIVVLFFAIYYPPIIPVNFIYILSFGSLVYILFNCFVLEHGKLNIENNFTKMICIILIVMVFQTLVCIIFNNNILISLNFYIFILFGLIPIALFLVTYSKKHYISKTQLINDFIIVTLIQSFFCVFAYVNTEFQQWFINSMINYGYSATRFSQLATFRWYGMATELGFTTPIVQIIGSLMCIYFGISKKKYYYFICAIVLVFSGLINARTSILIFLVCLLFTIMYLIYKSKSAVILKRVIYFFIFLILVSIVVLNFMRIYSYDNYYWIVNGLLDFIGMNVDTQNVYSIGNYFYDSQNYVMPNNEYIILGSGLNLNQLEIPYRSDIGYINDIWKYGVTIILIYYLTKKFLDFLNNNDINNYFYTLIKFIFIIVLIISNIKGNVFSMNPLSAFVILFVLCISSKAINN